jgi:hypothetical protein
MTPRSLIVTCADAPPATTASSAIFNLPDSNQQPATAVLDPRGRREEQKSERKKEDREQI